MMALNGAKIDIFILIILTDFLTFNKFCALDFDFRRFLLDMIRWHKITSSGFPKPKIKKVPVCYSFLAFSTIMLP